MGEKKHLRVVSYNIHKGLSFHGQTYVLDKIKGALKGVGAELLFLQEVTGKHIKGQSQFEFLADQIWSHYAYGKNAVYNEGHHGNAILSEYPFLSWHNENLSLHSLEKRGLLHGVIDWVKAEKRLHVLNVHLNLLGFHRRQQMDIVINYIEKNIAPDEPVIFAGDFNDWAKEITPRMSAHGFNEIHQDLPGQGQSFPSFFPLLSLDRIYYRNLRLTSAKVLKQAPWSSLSDHLALMADFEI